MTDKIYATQTVSVSELRKSPVEYFQDTPVAVLSNNKTKGYTVGKEYFERLMQIVEEAESQRAAQFQPSAQRLNQIVANASDILENLSDDELSDFREM